MRTERSKQCPGKKELTTSERDRTRRRLNDTQRNGMEYDVKKRISAQHLSRETYSLRYSQHYAHVTTFLQHTKSTIRTLFAASFNLFSAAMITYSAVTGGQKV
ncbi:hypothetical protein WMY93_031690 [Mugilogobius chulae]|uniref:Uncharacterized protein n=1 Tax=Mugilogobius chulae TaxID=88201 RepID=A0AAW0ME45_9GOBI